MAEQSHRDQEERDRPESDDPAERAASGDAGRAGIASLARLRDRVEHAAAEMKRLREENQALAERLRELEARPAVDPHSTLLSLNQDPDQLRRKISGFIEAIDAYLEKERQST